MSTMLNKKVKDLKLKQGLTVSELMTMFKDSGGFTAPKLAAAEDILLKMFKDKNVLKILSFPADIISTGTRGIIKELVKRKMFDAIITTCGTLDHDIARVYKDYYQGRFELDDHSLFKQGINRLGNVLIPNESYGLILEEVLQRFLENAYKIKKSWSGAELIYELGKHIDNENSIIYWGYKNNIPIFVPGLTDGSVGSQIWSFWERTRDFQVDLLKDEHELSNLIFTAKKSGALMLGGGISKHHTIWWNQFRGGLDYAVYITTAPEWDGSLSGARLREAVSWGKVNAKARFITVEGDVTVLVPLLFESLITKLEVFK